MTQFPVRGVLKQKGPLNVDVDAVVVVGVVVVAALVLEGVELVMGGSHISKNLLHPPGGCGSSSDGGRKRRDWTNQEFVKACRRLGCWLSNLSGEGSQTLSLDAVLSLSTVSSELKLLFRLKEKGLYRNLSRIDYTASVDN